jgi:hypothetical protein
MEGRGQHRENPEGPHRVDESGGEAQSERLRRRRREEADQEWFSHRKTSHQGRRDGH